jgi:hypothetical protein
MTIHHSGSLETQVKSGVLGYKSKEANDWRSSIPASTSVAPRSILL